MFSTSLYNILSEKMYHQSNFFLGLLLPYTCECIRPCHQKYSMNVRFLCKKISEGNRKAREESKESVFGMINNTTKIGPNVSIDRDGGFIFCSRPRSRSCLPNYGNLALPNSQPTNHLRPFSSLQQTNTSQSTSSHLAN